MVVATVDPSETERFDLKTLPEGFVVLRRMSYGQIVERRAMTKLSIDASGQGKNRDFKGEMAMASKEVAMFEFKHTIVEHNLTKKDDSLLNFALPVDFASLNPRVGQEIEGYIGEMNNFDEDDQGN